MAFWTTVEIRILKTFRDTVSPKSLYAMLPRHTSHAINIMARKYDLKRYRKKAKKKKKNWLQIAHKHFAKRELEMRDAG